METVKKNRRWYVVDKNGTECEFKREPVRCLNWWTLYSTPTHRDYSELSSGTIEQITGKKLTWADEPLEWWDDKEREEKERGITITHVKDQQANCVINPEHLKNQPSTTITYTTTAMQLCPKCNGQGTVSKPPYVPGDVNEWTSTSAVFTCDLCNGNKVVYSIPPTPPKDRVMDEGKKPDIINKNKSHHTVSQELRTWAENVLSVHSENYRAFKAMHDKSPRPGKSIVQHPDAIDAMLQFAIEVAEQRNPFFRMMNEALHKVEDLVAQNAKQEQRIVELETHIKRLRVRPIGSSIPPIELHKFNENDVDPDIANK